MHIFRFLNSGGPRLGLLLDGERFDLTAVSPDFSDVAMWLSLSDPVAAILDVHSRVRNFPLSGPDR